MPLVRLNDSYAWHADSKFHKKAQELILNSDYELYTTSKNISEFLVVLTRTESVRIDVIEVLEILKNLLSNFVILYPSKEIYLKFEELLKNYQPRGLRIYDFEIISTYK